MELNSGVCSLEAVELGDESALTKRVAVARSTYSVGEVPKSMIAVVEVVRCVVEVV